MIALQSLYKCIKQSGCIVLSYNFDKKINDKSIF